MDVEYYTFDGPEFNKIDQRAVGKLDFSDNGWDEFRINNPNIISKDDFTDDYEFFEDDYSFKNDCQQAVKLKEKMAVWLKENEQKYRKELLKDFIDKAEMSELKSRMNRTKELLLRKMPDTCDVYSAQCAWKDGKFSTYEYYAPGMTDAERADYAARYTAHVRNSPFYKETHHPNIVFAGAFFLSLLSIWGLASYGFTLALLLCMLWVGIIPALAIATGVTILYECVYASCFGVESDKKQIAKIGAFSAAAATSYIIANKTSKKEREKTRNKHI